jgi:hypothetical protein
VLAVLVLALGATPAAAQGPPFGPVSPADGATVSPDPDGIPVVLTCPLYTKIPGLPDSGGPSDYTVTFSRSPALGTDGRLRDDGIVSLNEAAESNTVPAGQCVSALAAGGGQRPQETPGTYYWQISRLCLACPGDYEAGPVRRLIVRSNASVRLRSPRVAYAGYALILPVKAVGAQGGSRVRIQRKAGSRWKTVASGTVISDQAELTARFKRGSVRLRALVQIGADRVASPTRTLKVKPARGWRTGPADDGRYRGKLSTRLTATGDGRRIKGFTTSVPMLCPGIPPGTFTTLIGTAALRAMKVAPDGSFVGVSTPSGKTSIRVRGKLRNRRVSGRAELSVGTCTGSIKFSARRSG